LKIGKSSHSTGSAFQPEAQYYWPSPTAQRPNRPMLAGAAHVPGVVTVRWPRTQWRGRRGLAGGLGVALPSGTPRGSDDGCAGQGGVAGFSSETAGGGGAEKMVRRGGILRRSWSSGGRGGHRRGPAAGGGDGGGEARSKRGGRRGHRGSSLKGRETVMRQRKDEAVVAVRSVGADMRLRREGKGVTGCSGALVREDERGKKGGAAVTGRPL
jgi:hypothetical protein